MLIVMAKGASRAQIEKVCQRIRELGFVPNEIPGAMRTAIGITGNQGPLSPESFAHLSGVADCVPVSKPYKLVSREVKPDATLIDVRGAKLDPPNIVGYAGQDGVSVGAIAVDRNDARAAWIWAVADNIRLQAENAVGVARLLAGHTGTFKPQ